MDKKSYEDGYCDCYAHFRSKMTSLQDVIRYSDTITLPEVWEKIERICNNVNSVRSALLTAEERNKK